jgi:uncharacterized membrane protein YccF (DUF307 family)
MWLQELDQLKKFIVLIGSIPYDFTAYNIVPQLSILPFGAKRNSTEELRQLRLT